MAYKDLAQAAPYYDDFQESLNFLRQVFVPGRAVQARELTQIGTILQNQVEKLSNHIFEDNSPVFRGRISVNNARATITISPDQYTGSAGAQTLSGSTHDVSNWVGKRFGNAETVNDSDQIIVITAVDNSDPANPILFYEYSGKNVEADQYLYDLAGVGSGVGWILIDSNGPRLSRVAQCEPGIIWTRGHFVTINSQEVFVNDSTDVSRFEIGYEMVERIVTESDSELGTKLLDPANGSPNANAPGAHRYVIEARLAVKDVNNPPADSTFLSRFTPFLTIEGNRIIKDQDKPIYSDLLKLLAERTFEESGNYTISEFPFEIDKNSDPTKMTAKIGVGEVYVKGFNIEKQSTTKIELDRAREYRTVPNIRKNFREPFYFVIALEDESERKPEGTVDGGDSLLFDRRELVEVRDGGGEVLGEVRILSINRVAGEIRVYVGGIDPIASRLTEAREIGAGNRSLTLKTVIVSDDGQRVPVVGGQSNPLILPLPNVETIRSHDESETEIPVVGRYSVSLIAGAATVNAPAPNIDFDSDGLVFIYNETQNKLVDFDPSLVSFSPNNGSTPSSFVIDVNAAITAGNGDFAASDILIVYVKERHFGDNPRTKNPITTSDDLTITSTQDLATLTQEDVIEITEIRQLTNIAVGTPGEPVASDAGSGSPAGTTEYVLTGPELRRLILDGGQKDFWYEAGKVSGFLKLSNKNDINANTDYRITYRYYDHVGTATANSYFSVNSYIAENENTLINIPFYNSERFGRYDLINCFDFRRKLSELSGAGARVPDFRESIQTDVENYLGRSDIIAIDSKGRFIVHKGIPSRNPVFPKVPSDQMPLFRLYIPPYTFRTKDVDVESIANPRYRMEDIKRLDDRIKRLEDAVSLNALEKDAYDLKITDSETGLDRFKSGIFVDNFQKGHTFGDSQNPNYRIGFSKIGASITTPVLTYNVPLEPNVSVSSGVSEYPDVVTLAPSGEAVVAANPTATTIENLNPYLFYTWVGTVDLTPAVDTWLETRRRPTRRVTRGSFEPPAGFNPDWTIDQIQSDWVGLSPEELRLPPSGVETVTQTSDRVRQTLQIDAWTQELGMTEDDLDRQGIARLEEIIASDEAQAVLQNNIRRGGIHRARFNFDIQFSDDVEGEFRVSDEIGRLSTFQIQFPSSMRDDPSIQNLIENQGLFKIFNNNGATETVTDTRTTIIDDWEFGDRSVISTEDLGDITNGTNNRRLSAIQNGETVFIPDEIESENGIVSSGTILASRRNSRVEVRDVLDRFERTTSSDRVVASYASFWARPRDIFFRAEGMRPGVEIITILDDREVEFYVTDDDFKKPDGTPVVSPEGTIEGFFRIPPTTFRTGTYLFTVLDKEGTSQANTVFTSSGTVQERQRTITTVRSVEVRQVRRTIENVELISIDVDRNVVEENIRTGGDIETRWVDPIAQSFLIEEENGVMLKSVDVFFATKPGDFNPTPPEIEAQLPGFIQRDPSDDMPVSVWIVTVENGTPTQNIVPFSRKTLPASAVNADIDNPQNGRTTFTFDNPVYLDEGEYALVVFSNSKQYHAWISVLGEQDIYENGRSNPGLGVAEQPYLGSFFRSQNTSTWTPDQQADLTFELKRYTYDTATVGQLALDDSKQDDTEEVVRRWVSDTNGGSYAYKQRVVFDDAGTDRIYFNKTGNNTDDDPATDTLNWGESPIANIVETNSDGSVLVKNSLYDDFRDRIYAHAFLPMIGNLATRGTSLSFSRAFWSTSRPSVGSSSNWIECLNLKNNLLVQEEEINDLLAGTRRNFTIRGSLFTNSENTSPIIDKKRLRTVVYQNDVRGIDPRFTWRGEWEAAPATPYSQNDAVFIAGSPDLFYVATVPTPTAGTDPRENPSEWQLREDVTLNEPDANSNVIGDSGTYITKSIQLENPADDLRVILDSAEPNQSYIRVYYQILDYIPRYAEVKANTLPYGDLNGVVCNVFYQDSGNNDEFQIEDANGNVNLAQIDNIQVVSGSNDRAFISSISSPSALDTTAVSGGARGFANVILSNATILKNWIERGNEIPQWNSTLDYTYGKIVRRGTASSDQSFWIAQGYVGDFPTWSAGTYNDGDVVKYNPNGRFYICNVEGGTTTAEPSTSGDWVILADAPSYGRGTVPTEEGNAWLRIPAVALEIPATPGPMLLEQDQRQWREMKTDYNTLKTANTGRRFQETTFVPNEAPGVEFENFRIKIELKSINTRVDVPKVRNLRVVATL